MQKNLFEEPNIQEDSITALSQKLLMVTAQLQESNNKLQHLQDERAAMLANISHDLRAPVTAIRGAVDYLLSDSQISAEERASILQLMDRRTKTLESLIHDMYDLFSLENSNKELSWELISAAPFIEEYFYSSILDARYENFDLQLDMPENLDCQLKIDIHKIIRVLDNLLTNASKYSEPNTKIILKVELSTDRTSLLISVIDQGIGIPEDSLSKVFNRTYTVSSARTPNTSTGSGLGLSIAKAIVEKHHGSICCKSQVGKGSTFTITLPTVL